MLRADFILRSVLSIVLFLNVENLCLSFRSTQEYLKLFYLLNFTIQIILIILSHSLSLTIPFSYLPLPCLNLPLEMIQINLMRLDDMIGLHHLLLIDQFHRN